MAASSTRIEIDLFDQFAHRRFAVTHNLRRIAPRGGDQLAAHHQQAEVVAGNITLTIT